MKRQKVTRLQFLVVSCLSLTVSLALVYICDLHREQVELQEVVELLDAASGERVEMVEQLKEHHERVMELQRRNDALEDLLFNRAWNYRAVVGDLEAAGTGFRLPSRSGYAEGGTENAVLSIPVRSRSGFTEGDFEHVWQAYGAARLAGTGTILLQAEEYFGINAIVLAAIVVHESDWGSSAIARDKNNLAGLGAYDGSAYSSAMTFASKADSIYFLAELLDRHYLTPGGRHYNGLDLVGIGRKYASDPRWAQKVAGRIRLIVETAVGNPELLLAYTGEGIDWD